MMDQEFYFLLNPELPPPVITAFSKKWVIQYIEHNGALCYVMMVGQHKTPPPHITEEMRQEWSTESEYWRIMGQIVDVPEPCQLIEQTVPENKLSALSKIFHIVGVKHKGENRLGIACGWYREDPNAFISPQVISQWRIY